MESAELKTLKIHKLTDSQYINAELAGKIEDNAVYLVKETNVLYANPSSLTEVIKKAKPNTIIKLVTTDDTYDFGTLVLEGGKYPDNLTLTMDELSTKQPRFTCIAICNLLKDSSENLMYNAGYLDTLMPENLVLDSLSIAGLECFNCTLDGLTIRNCDLSCVNIYPNSLIADSFVPGVGTADALLGAQITSYTRRTLKNLTIEGCNYISGLSNYTNGITISDGVYNCFINKNNFEDCSLIVGTAYHEVSGKIVIIKNTCGSLIINAAEDSASVHMLYNTFTASSRPVSADIGANCSFITASETNWDVSYEGEETNTWKGNKISIGNGIELTVEPSKDSFVSKSGDTMTGPLYMGNGYAKVLATQEEFQLESLTEQSGTKSRRLLNLRNKNKPGSEELSGALVLIDVDENGDSTGYPIYHTGNKPTVADIGAAVTFTCTGRIYKEASSWSEYTDQLGTTGYVQNVTVYCPKFLNVCSSDTPIVYVDTSSGDLDAIEHYENAFNQILRIVPETDNGEIGATAYVNVYAKSLPGTDIPIILKVVR